jgi:hypothetical protein
MRMGPEKLIADDFALVSDIFSIVDVGILGGYDSYCYEVKVCDGYMDTELTVKRNGTDVTNARTDFNDAILYRLVKQLNESAEQRGERWSAFVMSYSHGENVKVAFKY